MLLISNFDSFKKQLQLTHTVTQSHGVSILLSKDFT